MSGSAAPRVAGRVGVLIVGAVLAAAGGVAAASSWWDAYPAGPEEILEELSPEGRPLPWRTSIDLPWAPFTGRQVIEAPELESALLMANSADWRWPSARVVFHLARAEAGDLDRATRSALAESEGWWRENDLALVQLARGEPEEALDHLERAAAQGGGPVAAFNRPAVLAALGLQLEVLEALRTCEHEAGRDWGGECARRRAELEARGPARLDPLDRSRLRDGLLDARGPGDLAPLRAGIEGLAATGDRILQRQLRELETLDEAGWSSWLRETGALRAYWNGIRDHGDARPPALLARSSHPLVQLRVLHYRAFALEQTGGTDAAREALAAFQRRALELDAPEELAMAISEMGTLALREYDWVEAATLWDEALRKLPPGSTSRYPLLRKMADLEVAKELPIAARDLIHQALPSEQDDAGVGFVGPGPVSGILAGRLRNVVSLLMVAARNARIGGWPAAQQAYLREALRRTEQLEGRPDQRAQVLLQLSRSLREQGRAEEARGRLLDELSRLSVAWGSLRSQLLAELADAELAAGRPAAALEHAREASRLGAGADASTRKVVATALARVLLASRAPAGALDAALEAYRISEERRGKNRLEELLLERENAEVIALLARARIAAGDVAGAMEVAGGGALPALLPGECRVLVLQDRDGLLALFASPTGLRTLFVRVDPGTYRRSRREERPVSDLLGGVFAPDRCPASTTRIGFIQTTSSAAPSLPFEIKRQEPRLSVAVLSRASASWPFTRASGPALLVRDPRLPASIRERDALAAWIPGVEELQASRIGGSQLLDAMRTKGVLHLALHGRASPHSIAATYLELGPAQRLRGSDVLESRFMLRPLVVLAACRTAGQGGLDPEGGLLPRAFLDAGAGAVVAANVDVPDDLAAWYAEGLYRRLGSGQGVEQAHHEAVAEVADAAGPQAYSFMLFF